MRRYITTGLALALLSACGSTAPSQQGSVGNPLFSAAASTPPAISRADLMSRYAQLAPLDKSATPETVDNLSDSACKKLREGVSTDKLITVGTDIFKANATEVMRLLVSYRCPEFLKDFK